MKDRAFRERHPAPPRGSWRWAVRLAEGTAWATALLVLTLVLTADLSPPELARGLALTALLCAWLFALFRYLMVKFTEHRAILGIGIGVNLLFAGGIYLLLRSEVPSIQLIFVPVVVITGLFGRLPEAIAAALAALLIYGVAAAATGAPVDASPFLLSAGVLLLSGTVAALLARELRSHYQAERAEHRLATAVRHRLMAVLDAVDEGIVFSDRGGVTRLVNRRATEMFSVRPDEFLGSVVVELQRSLARKTEDPEGFMETFQELRDDPMLELRADIEQILPARRRLRLYSSPARDDAGVLVGRIDVYTDVTEAVEHAAEVERLYQQARSVAESYQRSLLPDTTPALPRLSFVAHYVPAAGRRAVCGDFYDFIPLPDGRMGVVLGDVSGVGPAAVGDGALTRYTLKSFVAEEPNPGKLLERMNSHIHAQLPSDRFVRVLFGIIDPERAVFEYANAGHVPPIVFHCRSGEVEWLGEGGIALTVEEDAEYKVGRMELAPGDMLVMYTDGVTEAPRHGRPFGQGRFMDLVKAYGVGTPGEMSQAIRRAVDAWVEEGALRDDIAILVAQVVPDAAIGEPTRELVLPNDVARLSEVRAFVASFLADLRVAVDSSTEILLAVGEAAGNAARHGRRGDGRSEVRVHCEVSGDELIVTIADDGPGFDAVSIDSDTLPDRFAPGGRGIFLMERLMDGVQIDSSPGGTMVRMTRRVTRNP